MPIHRRTGVLEDELKLAAKDSRGHVPGVCSSGERRLGHGQEMGQHGEIRPEERARHARNQADG